MQYAKCKWNWTERQREKRDAGKNRDDEGKDVDSKASVDVLESVVGASPWCRILVFQSADYLVVLSLLAIYVQPSRRVVQYVLFVRQRAVDAKVLDGYSPRNIPRMLGSWKAARPLGRLNSQRKAQRKIEENPQYLIIKRPHSAPGQANPEQWRLR
jgi:hypothetical protein